MLAYPLEASRLPNLMVEGRSHGGARPAPLERDLPLFVESRNVSRLLFHRASYRKTASHFPGSTLSRALPLGAAGAAGRRSRAASRTTPITSCNARHALSSYGIDLLALRSPTCGHPHAVRLRHAAATHERGRGPGGEPLGDTQGLPGPSGSLHSVEHAGERVLGGFWGVRNIPRQAGTQLQRSGTQNWTTQRSGTQNFETQNWHWLTQRNGTDTQLTQRSHNGFPTVGQAPVDKARPEPDGSVSGMRGSGLAVSGGTRGGGQGCWRSLHMLVLDIPSPSRLA